MRLNCRFYVVGDAEPALVAVADWLAFVEPRSDRGGVS